MRLNNRLTSKHSLVNVCLVIIVFFQFSILCKQNRRINALTSMITQHEKEFIGDGYSSRNLRLLESRMLNPETKMNLIYFLINDDNSSTYQTELHFLEERYKCAPSVLRVVSFRLQPALDSLGILYDLISPRRILFNESIMTFSSLAMLADLDGNIHTVYYLNPYQVVDAMVKIERIKSLMESLEP